MTVLARALKKQEGGQVFALLAVGITAIIGLAAFAVDVGAWYQAQRSVQAAADAGATAAADDLPSNASQATTDASTYVNKNVSGATTTVVTPYTGDSSKVKVTVSKSVPTFFAKIFGISSVSVSASSAAKSVAGANGKYAIYANNSTCGNQSITIPGGDLTVNGPVHSSGDLKVSGANLTVNAPTTYGGPNHCGWRQSGANPNYNGSSSPTADYSTTTWPEPWSTSNIPCTYTLSGTQTIPSSGTVLPTGVYCDYGGTLKISAAGVSGVVALVAGRVQISGANVGLTPYYGDLLIYNIGTSAFQWSGAGAGTTGTIYAPQANAQISGSSGSAYNLFIEADTVSISGQGWTLTGNGPTASGMNGSQLIE
jgi:hypothetical protein